VRTRTKLTTPPGQEPDPVVSSPSVREEEHYSPGFSLPVEPIHLTRAERITLLLIALVVTAQLAVGLVALLSATQAEDPAMVEGALGGSALVREG
jgi:hypothetical protein